SKLDDHLVTGDLQDAAGDTLADGEFLHELIGGRRLELLPSQLEPPGLRLRREDNGPNHLAGVFPFPWALNTFFVRKLRNVDEALDAFLDFDKRTEFRNPRHLAFNDLSIGVSIFDGVPRIPEHLLEPEAEPPRGRLHFQDDGLHAFALLQ